MVDKPRPMLLQFRTSDIDALFDGLRNIPRAKFIGQCKYRGGNIGKHPASYFILKLTDEEAAYIALKIEAIVTRLPKRSGVKFTQNVDTHYFE